MNNKTAAPGRRMQGFPADIGRIDDYGTNARITPVIC
jgi:hypothetical protein